MKLVLNGIIEEEIDENCWVITLKRSLAKKISIDSLHAYVYEFLKKKREQVTEANVPATFYMWFDEQSIQLQLNILSGHTLKLPFDCQVNIVNNVNPILKNLIAASKRGCIPLSEIEFVDETSDEEDYPANYILDVFLQLM